MNPNKAPLNRLASVFFADVEERIANLKTKGTRLVYYTTAEVASSIIRKQEVWMRSTSVMNDYLEVQHGMDCLRLAWHDSQVGKKLKAALDICFPGASERLRVAYNHWNPNMRADTFIICVSEHDSSEDQHGRLSMWRAYGPRNGVALVFNPEVMQSEADVLGAYSHPVSYLSPEAFANHFAAMADRINANVEFLRTVGPDLVHQFAFHALMWGALCTKHPGFHEEREWRVVACPSIFPTKVLRREIEVVRGAPQLVMKMDLRDYPEQKLVGLSIPSLLNRVIIGPCETPGVMRRAFEDLLSEAGVSDAAAKVVVSDLPLRQTL